MFQGNSRDINCKAYFRSATYEKDMASALWSEGVNPDVASTCCVDAMKRSVASVRSPAHCGERNIQSICRFPFVLGPRGTCRNSAEPSPLDLYVLLQSPPHTARSHVLKSSSSPPQHRLKKFVILPSGLS